MQRSAMYINKHETIETRQDNQIFGTFDTLVSDVSNARSKQYVNQNFQVYDSRRRTKTCNAEFVIVIVQLSKIAK